MKDAIRAGLDHVWAASNGPCGIYQVDRVNKTLVQFHVPPQCSTAIGVSIDIEKFVWLVDQEGWAWKIDPDNVPGMQQVQVPGSHYVYSDMTGGQVLSIPSRSDLIPRHMNGQLGPGDLLARPSSLRHPHEYVMCTRNAVPTGAFGTLVIDSWQLPVALWRIDTEFCPPFLYRLTGAANVASDEMPTVNVPVASTVSRVEVDDEFRTVELRLSEGAVWDALAALRRIIERRLVLYAADHQIALPSRPGAGRIVEMLRRNNPINDDIATNLRASIDIANRGVHGLDVSTEQAYYALRLAQDSLSGLKVG